MKSGKPVFVVDSVDKAVKFYSEKLGFDIVELSSQQENGSRFINYAQFKKGKCFISFRVPLVGELAEMSMIKHCPGRGAGVYIEMKKGLEKYLERCKKKGLTIVDQPKKQPWGDVTFSVKDPFGLRLTFAQPIEGEVDFDKMDFCGMKVAQKPVGEQIEDMIGWLKGFGILRRVAKKYAKLWLKKVVGKK